MAIGLGCLALTGEAVQAEMPWQTSRLLYTHSEPAIVDNRTHSFAQMENRLALVSETGMVMLAWDGENWSEMSRVEVDAPVGAAWTRDNQLLLLSKSASYIVNANRGSLHRVHGLPTVGNNAASVGKVPGRPLAAVQIGPHTFAVEPYRGEAVALDISLGSGRTAMTRSDADDALFILVDGRLYVWTADMDQPEAWTDRSGSRPAFGSDASQMVPHPAGGLLFIGTHGQGLHVVDLANRSTTHMTNATHPELTSDLFYASMAIDAEQDTLYYTSWTETTGLSPASDPENWEAVAYLASFTEPGLHTYRSNSPNAGMAYVPESDELIFGGRWGASVLSRGKDTALVQAENFEQFVRTPESIPGQGRFYDFMRENRMRSGWTGSGRASEPEHLDNLERAQINTILYNLYYVGHGEFYGPTDHEQRLRGLAEQCDERGMVIIASFRPIGTSAMSHSGVRDYDYRHWILPSGEVAAYEEPSEATLGTRDRREFPCPMDEGYWARSIAPMMNLAAQVGLEHESIMGVLFELGDGFGGSNLSPRNNTCFCDDCWARFLDRQAIYDSQARDTSYEDGARRRWLYSEGLWGVYHDSQVASLGEVGQKFLAEAREINPELSTHLALPEAGIHYEENWWYRGFIAAMQSEDMPVVIQSQQTYGTPYNPVMDYLLEQRLKEQGKHTIVVPGLALLWLSPEQVTRRYEKKNHQSPGVFVYRTDNWYGRSLDENHFRPRLPNDDREYLRREYVDALEAADLE
ncbi:hypothetical protein ACERK3_07965 [Phycisphaerales bacterium AB-hyl4]|uniref:Glycoside hydrolase family 42 N-terminal domain-containing protein n=1 Tax=Natronomicrosphaera hydrolytica TaxID=3242702 RepID=A0ABV4U3Q2_9BACT